MIYDRPFGADTLLIAFTRQHRPAPTPRIARMSRMRRAGEQFRHGVSHTADDDPAAVPADESRARR